MTEESSPQGKGGVLAGIGTCLRWVDKGTEFIEKSILGAGVLAMAAMLVANVISRNVLGSSVRGVFELTQILIVVITFIGLGYGFRNARHISMSALYDQLKGTARKAMLIFIMSLTAVLMFYLATVALDYVQSAYNRGSRTSAFEIPWWTVYLVAPLGFTLAGIQLVLAVFKNLTSKEIYRSFRDLEEYDEPDEGV